MSTSDEDLVRQLREARDEAAGQINELARSSKRELFIETLRRQQVGRTPDLESYMALQTAVSPYLGRIAFYQLAWLCAAGSYEEGDIGHLDADGHDLVVEVVSLYGQKIKRAYFADPDYADRGHDWRSITSSVTQRLDDEDEDSQYTVHFWKRNGDVAMLKGSPGSLARLIANLLGVLSEMNLAELDESARRRLESAYSQVKPGLPDPR